MNTIDFPKMFSGNATKILKDTDATMKSIYLLLNSECGELFGDPEFGVNIKKYMYEKNNLVLRDIIVDELYSKLTTFCPQIYLERNNITITQDGMKLYAHIPYKDRLSFQNNGFDLVLYDAEVEE